MKPFATDSTVMTGWGGAPHRWLPSACADPAVLLVVKDLQTLQLVAMVIGRAQFSAC